jgi:hypothetical protein
MASPDWPTLPMSYQGVVVDVDEAEGAVVCNAWLRRLTTSTRQFLMHAGSQGQTAEVVTTIVSSVCRLRATLQYTIQVKVYCIPAKRSAEALTAVVDISLS